MHHESCTLNQIPDAFCDCATPFVVCTATMGGMEIEIQLDTPSIPNAMMEILAKNLPFGSVESLSFTLMSKV
jgi:hypothetical protein